MTAQKTTSAHPAAALEKALAAYRQDLNEAQWEAVIHDGGPLLVIAGAGTGKTRTLTYRVARLVLQGVDPRAILLLTFTRKASREMLRRASALLDDRCSAVSGGTFHAFAHGVLRRYAGRLGLDRAFTIIDRADAESLVGQIRKESNVPTRGFPTKRTLTDIFSQCVNKDRGLEEILADGYGHLMPFLDTIAGIARQYRERKKLHRFLDYDDLLVELRNLLRTDPELCQRIAESYPHIMVDEYQDTNRLQADILYLLAHRHRNLMVVGDDAQSIYSFRGANFRNIMAFPEIFADTRVIRLEENYRSVQPVLSLTNALIAGATEKYPKHLFTRRPDGPLPRLVRTMSENAQSRWIIDEIRLLTRRGIGLEEIAVLFRAGYHSFDLEIELTREGIEFVKVGGFKFMESAHIKDLLAHLRVLVNPDDRLCWHRILQLLDKVGPKTAQSICDTIIDTRSGAAGLLDAPFSPRLAAVLTPLKELFSRLTREELSVAQMGEAVLAYYLPLLKDLHEDHPRRARDLEQLLEIMERYERLETFLADMALEPPDQLVENGLHLPSGDERRLVLSTIHSAKGLEWHTVFVIWTLDGRFPSLRAIDTPEDLDEERRLMYVAATRARENLVFTCPMQAYDRAADMVLDRPSRFLTDIDADLLESIDEAPDMDWRLDW
ncbi:MAG: ATP-dependent helicase [Desulfobacteraceae bacterium]|jgi:DNA helicase-2/ATP-dependent DNA helicase PcrA|nr:ATP-dependent helicase [Desulfobacteraceae bacterium]